MTWKNPQKAEEAGARATTDPWRSPHCALAPFAPAGEVPANDWWGTLGQSRGRTPVVGTRKGAI